MFEKVVFVWGSLLHAESVLLNAEPPNGVKSNNIVPLPGPGSQENEPILARNGTNVQGDKKNDQDDDNSDSSDDSAGFDYEAAEKQPCEEQVGTANLSDLIAKVEKIVENAQNLNLFSTPLGHVFTGLLSIMVGTFGFYAMYCQFFEVSAFDMDMNILFSDVERSISFLRNPDLITPCLDNFESACVGPWAYAIWYAVLGAYLVLNGLMRFLRNLGPAWQRQQVGKKTSIVPSGSNRIITVKSVFGPTINKNFAPGGKYFWVAVMSLMSINMIFQILRCFVVDGSYATTNASIAIVHVITMILHFDLSLLMYLVDSEFSAITVGLFANIAYLAIRTFCTEGYLATTSTSFLDFMTTAVPFFLCMLALNTLTKPIARKKGPRSRRKGRNYSTDQKTDEHANLFSTGSLVQWVISSLPRSPARTGATVFFGLGATIVGFIAVSTIIEKSQNECPSGLDHGNHDLLPVGFECVEWQFNMFLSSPACSCKYLHVDVLGCDEQDYNVSSFGDYLNPLVDHLEDTKFLAVNYNPDCRRNDGSGANAAHSEFVAASLNGLQMVSLHGDLGFESLPQNGWSNAIGIHLYAPHLKRINSITLNSWSKLQVFDCSPCPSLSSANLFSQASDKWPRLRSVSLEGVSSCPEGKFGLDGLSSYHCTDRHKRSSECGAISKWVLEHLESQIQQTTATDCNEPSCTFFLDQFELFDGSHTKENPDALLDKDEFAAYLRHVGFPDIENITAIDAYSCMVSSLREQVLFDQTLYEDLKPSGGVTLHEFLASQTSVSNCADCDRTQKLITAGAAVFEEQTFSECKTINSYVVDPVELQPACIPNNDACDVACPAYIRYYQIFDRDHDEFLNETEYINARSVADKDLPRGQLDCFLALAGSDCVDNSDGLQNLKMHLTNVISITMWQDDVVDLSSCAACFIDASLDQVPQENEFQCADNLEFRDAHDNTCEYWQSADCSDWFYELQNDYTLFDLHEVEYNCPLSCGYCSPWDDQTATDYEGICQDNIEFRDAHDNSCAHWKDQACDDWEYHFGQYTLLQLQQVELNCPVSCEICQPPEDGSDITCKDNFDFQDPDGESCVYWQNFDCSDWRDHMSERGYTREQMQQVQLYCPSSCSICQGKCEHTCLYIHNEDCDDGGPGSAYDVCDYGTDCNDCCAMAGSNRAECTHADAHEHWCADVEGFTDSWGYPCSAWIGYDCLDYATAANWGYSTEEMIEIGEGCKYTCDFCTKPEDHIKKSFKNWLKEDPDRCVDVEGFTARGSYSCNHFSGHPQDCFHQSWVFKGWNAEEMIEVAENCPYSCDLCDRPDDQNENQDECIDSITYRDIADWPCEDWFRFSCFDLEYLSAGWGFTADDLNEVHENCPVACGLCEPPENQDECIDSDTYRDIYDSACDTWEGYDCSDVEFYSTTFGYTADDMIELQESCPVACGLCTAP